jgi:hypothetical protein
MTHVLISVYVASFSDVVNHAYVDVTMRTKRFVLAKYTIWLMQYTGHVPGDLLHMCSVLTLASLTI